MGGELKMENMRLIKKSRKASLAIVFVILIGRLVTGIVYNNYDLMEQWGIYGNIDPLVIELALLVLMLLDYFMLKQSEQEEKDEKYNKKVRRTLIEIIGVKLFFIFYFSLIFIKWLMEIIMGSFLFNAYM